MKMILAGIFAVMVSLTVAGSAYADELTKGDRVQVRPGSGKLNILYAINGNFLGQHSDGALGTVMGTGQSSDGMNWVYVDYDAGVDGWSTDQSLVKVGASAAPASTSSS